VSKMLPIVEHVYETLGDVTNHYPERHSSHGQALLVALLEFIARETGRNEQDVQDDYCNRALTRFVPYMEAK